MNNIEIDPDLLEMARQEELENKARKYDELIIRLKRNLKYRGTQGISLSVSSNPYTSKPYNIEDYHFFKNMLEEFNKENNE